MDYTDQEYGSANKLNTTAKHQILRLLGSFGFWEICKAVNVNGKWLFSVALTLSRDCGEFPG